MPKYKKKVVKQFQNVLILNFVLGKYKNVAKVKIKTYNYE